MSVTIDGGQILQGIAAILLALSTMVVPWLSLRASQKNSEKLATVDAKVANIDAKVATVDVKVNDSNTVLGQLEKTTNSLSERNEAIAKKLGIEEGRKLGRADHLAEQAAEALAIKKSDDKKA